MKFEAKFEVLQLADLVTPPYNPRVDMEPDSPEYKALRRSLEQHQLVEPPVVNLHNMRCIGGNQRVAVMLALGMTEVLCSVIDQPDESKEKKLCLALNRIDGRWDTDKLGDLLRDKAPNVVAVLAGVTGEKISLLAVCGKDAVAKGVKAGELVKKVSAICGGSGGGKPDSAMGGGKDLLKLDDALAAVDDFVSEKLGL